ncbi:MAG: hypothetical protein GY950_17675 [bacterium]|nr:hypothetical protein [bacterium]
MIDTDLHRIYVNVDPQHPYPGLYSFRETDSGYFHGRQRETNDLAGLIGDNVLTVVFGKSGVGKTSLLRAGLIPHLSGRYFLPIYLRIDFNDKEKSPIAQVKEAVVSEIKKLARSAEPFGDLTLWEYFSAVKIRKGFIKPLLFFDQFEEMFSIGKNNPESVNQLVTEIADLVENRVPVSVQEKLEKGNKTIDYSRREPDFRVVFSLREDYLPQLEMLYKHIPSVRYSRYRVSQMKGKEAIDAVLKPGEEIIKDPEVGVEIIKKIPGAKDADYKPYENIAESWETKKIEPFLLSLFCFQVNENRMEAGAKEITGEMVKGVYTEDIIKDYYEKNIGRFNPNVKTAIEDLLLTGDGHRKLEAVDSLKSGYGITAEEIGRLVNRRIIRQETRLGIDYVELIHDVLVPILEESRERRREGERREKELAAKKRKYGRVILAIVCMAAVSLALLTWYAFEQKKKAEKENQINKAYGLAAYSTNLLDKDPTLSFRLAESAYLTERSNPAAYNALLSAYYTGGDDNTDRLWHTAFENGFDQLTRHTSERSDFFAAFSPNGKWILTVSSDKAILWDRDGRRVKSVEPGAGLRLRKNAAFSPDAKYIAFLTNSDKEIGLWALDEKEMASLKFEEGVNSAAFSHDNKHIITANRDHNARLWDLKGNMLAVFKGHTGEVNSAVFSNDDKYIVTAGWDKTIRLWDSKGNEIKTFPVQNQGVYSAEFSRDGQKIVTAGQDGTARLWDLNGQEEVVFEGHTGEVRFARFSPGGKYIITGSDDHTARLWDLKGIQVFKFKEAKDVIHTASFSPEGSDILIAPARGPVRLRLVNRKAILDSVNKQGIRRLNEEEKRKYNIIK